VRFDPHREVKIPFSIPHRTKQAEKEETSQDFELPAKGSGNEQLQDFFHNL